MTIENELMADVRYAGVDASDRIAHLQKELAQLLGEQRDTEAHIAEASDAATRVSTYTAAQASALVCPRCWVDAGKQVKIKPIKSASHTDSFRCDGCGAVFDTPA
jgi:predicted RNA-binding Zn-ribbon protein involved in translation (DUF1610 family)